MNNNYVSIDNVLAKINDDYAFEIDEGILIKWIAEALGFLNVNMLGMEERIAVVDVSNYQCRLPRFCKSIIQIVKNNNSESINSDSIVSSTGTITTYDDDDRIVDLEEFNIINIPYLEFNYSYYGFNKMTKNNFTSVKLANNNLFKISVCDIDPIYVTDGAEYTIVGEDTLRFSFESAQVVIIFLQQRLDENGYPLIPDDTYVIDAISKYILYRMSVREYVQHRQGSVDRKREIEDDWLRAKNTVTSMYMVPRSLEEYNNLLKSTNKLLPRTDRHENFYKE